MKKVLVVLLALFICTVSNVNAIADRNVTLNDQLLNKQFQSLTEYNKIIEAVNNKDTSLLATKNNISNYFGGAYLNDKKQLVTLVTENNKTVVNELIKLTNNDNLIIKKVKFSYSHLQQTMNKINSYLYMNQKSDDKIINNINRITLHDDKNCIVVSLFRINEDYIKLFKNKVCSSECLIFKEDSKPILDESTAYVGQKIGAKNWISSGFKAKWNSPEGAVYGYVTCGHGMRGNDTIIDEQGNVLGRVRIIKYGDKVDASFFEVTDKNCRLTNIIYQERDYSQLDGANFLPAVGLTVSKFGHATNKTVGVVIASSVTARVGDTVFTNLVQTDYSSDAGDSGGFVGVESSNNRYVTAGIHKGSSGQYSFYVVASYIRDELNVDIVE